VTSAGGDFWGLGFDPLPGDPGVIKALENDARVFGQRMTEQADTLQKLAHRDGWQGEAADVFAQHLDTLPRDLRTCGKAFFEASIAIGNFYDAFVREKSKARELEERAVAARQKVQSTQFAYEAPTISAPGDCVPAKDRGPLDQAEDDLGVILREAHGFAERFNDSPEVQDLARTIRDCAQFAPDEPGWGIVRRWAGDVFKATPLGAAINPAHDLINRYSEFFYDLASVLSDISGTLGILSLPLLFLPPMGTAAAVLALGAAASSSAIKTSLFVGHARDANGKLYVDRGNLIRSYVDTGVNAVGVAGGAAASRAFKLAKSQPTTFAAELADSFSASTFRDALDAPGAAARLVQRGGAKAATKQILGDGIKTFRSAYPGHLYNRGGVGLAAVAPLTTATASNNYFGWRSPYSLKDDFPNLLTDAPNNPDLQLRTQPTIGPARTSEVTPTMGPSRPPIAPVMNE
jgi:hypothetical protein